MKISKAVVLLLLNRFPQIVPFVNSCPPAASGKLFSVIVGSHLYTSYITDLNTHLCLYHRTSLSSALAFREFGEQVPAHPVRKLSLLKLGVLESQAHGTYCSELLRHQSVNCTFPNPLFFFWSFSTDPPFHLREAGI